MHKTFTVARRGKLFNAPVHIGPGYRCNILDLGCGTGIWAIDVAEFVSSPPSASTCTHIHHLVHTTPKKSSFGGLTLP